MNNVPFLRVCDIKGGTQPPKSEWIKENDKLIYNIQANRFLQHMVRLLVGTMVEVSKGRITTSEFKKMLNGNKSKFTAVRAPSNGLFLHKIYYD